jgi:hypothetical protein
MKKFTKIALAAVLLSQITLSAFAAKGNNMDVIVQCPSIDAVKEVKFDMPYQVRGNRFAALSASANKLGTESNWMVAIAGLSAADTQEANTKIQTIDQVKQANAKKVRFARGQFVGCMYTSSQDKSVRVFAVTPKPSNEKEVVPTPEPANMMSITDGEDAS